MRLINVHDLCLYDFDEDERPRYAILSHRWGKEEVTYQQFRESEPATRRKEGFIKIEDCCKKAVEYDLSYVWIDTCCINSESSAELSESINSMYKWYNQSHVCFAYLSDVIVTPSTPDDLQEVSATGSFEQSVWFTRGWTLQELLAPRNLFFFNRDWTSLGSKKDLKNAVSRITGIDADIVGGQRPVNGASVARRFSWAAKRSCLRAEDVAYSLLGLFNVNMPMVYGEGSKAFVRLQAEILKNSRDHTIFAWSRPEDTHLHSGLLASHPRDFARSGDFVPFSGLNSESLLINTTNIGVSLEMMSAPPYMYAALNCVEVGKNDRFATIQLSAIDEDRKQYVRYAPAILESRPLHGRAKPRRMYVTHSMEHAFLTGVRLRYIQPELFRREGSWHVKSLLICPTIVARARDPTIPDIEAQDEPTEIAGQDCFKYRYSLPISPNRPAIVIRGCWMKQNTSEHDFQLAIGSRDDRRISAGILPADWTCDSYLDEDSHFMAACREPPFRYGLPYNSEIAVHVNLSNTASQQDNVYHMDLELKYSHPSTPSKRSLLSYAKFREVRKTLTRYLTRPDDEPIEKEV